MMDFIILAQVTDDVLSGFIDQIPTSLVVMVCGSGLLLFVAFAWFAYFKPLRKARQAKKETLLQPSSQQAPPPVIAPEPVVRDDEDDLPDLDLLMGDETVFQAPVDFVEPEPKPDPLPTVVPPTQLADTPILKLNTGHRLVSDPVLNIVRDTRDGRLVVVINGVGYRSLAEHDELKKQFVNIMRDLNQVVTKPDDNPPTDALEPQSQPSTYADSSNEYVPGKLPSFKLEDNMTPTNKGSYEVTSVPELNIAEAIEAYLQHKIRTTPEYRSRVIHIQPTSSGGVRIQVDNEYYESVSDIADGEVRGFIQQAIEEWQKLNS
jgi:hypothetical protein